MARATYQDGLTVLTEILPGREAAVKQTLEQIGREIETNSLVPFRRLTTVHFARWFVLDAGEDALHWPIRPSLVFSTNFDEPRARHLEELFDVAAAGLDAIYGHCRGYPAEGERTKERVLAYLREHEVGYNTLYVGTRGRTVRQIEQEAALREAIQLFLDQATRDAAFLRQDPGTIRAAIQEFVRSRPELAWALEPPPRPRRFWPRTRDLEIAVPVALLLLAVATGFAASFVTGVLVALGIAGVLVLVVGSWMLVIRAKERADPVDLPHVEFEHDERIAEEEDRFIQNPMSAVNTVKAGWFRRLTLRVVLRAIDLSARYILTKGELGGIPSIHFARWVVIEKGRRVLFMSNYDGSWESYLGDFIDKASTGLTAVWSNTHGFPRSRFLILEGAKDEQRFKAYARNSQVRTQVWYTAYKWLSVQNINNNSVIRAGLVGEQTPAETAAWLQAL